MRLEEFKELCKQYFRRPEYKQEGNVWHAKQLVYCRYKVLNQKYEDVVDKEAVLTGQLVHLAIGKVLGVEEREYSKRVGDYVVVGTPDLVFDGVPVEVKFTGYLPRNAREHDVMQLRIYMWLLGSNKGYLWYFSPREWMEIEVEGAMVNSDVLNLIENPKCPMFGWECRFCSLEDCPFRR